MLDRCHTVRLYLLHVPEPSGTSVFLDRWTPPVRFWGRLVPILVVIAGFSLPGCQSQPRLAGLNPFFQPERTSLETPAQQIAAIRAVAKRASQAQAPEQQELVADLVEKLESESDPLVREAILESAAAFSTPLASQAVVAGLKDTDPYVRQTCCRLLGERSGAASIEALTRAARADEEFDVRVAAVQALGKTDASGQTLVTILQDRDPAMQLAGVEAMRQMTGQDFGGNVAAYVALAKGETPATMPDQPATAVATRPTGWLPFF